MRAVKLERERSMHCCALKLLEGDGACASASNERAMRQVHVDRVRAKRTESVGDFLRRRLHDGAL
eukprot:3059748-Rhodomonas_salina.1